jgi:hypothetical protein
MPTPSQRLETAQTEINRAFSLINDLWTNEHLDLNFATRTLTEPERQIRELIVSTRIAIINTSNQIELLIDNN